MNFINTVHGRNEVPLRDYLFHILDLISWAQKLEVISPKDAKKLENHANSGIVKGLEFFNHAINLRELLYRIFHSVSLKKDISGDDLNAFNKILSSHFSHVKLNYENKLFNVEHEHPDNQYYKIISPVINDAYSLLLLNNTERIKECPSCGWLFLDTTKNGKRRWCNMKTCGSNIKALDWYYRQKQKNTGC